MLHCSYVYPYTHGYAGIHHERTLMYIYIPCILETGVEMCDEYFCVLSILNFCMRICFRLLEITGISNTSHLYSTNTRLLSQTASLNSHITFPNFLVYSILLLADLFDYTS